MDFELSCELRHFSSTATIVFPRFVVLHGTRIFNLNISFTLNSSVPEALSSSWF